MIFNWCIVRSCPVGSTPAPVGPDPLSNTLSRKQFPISLKSLDARVAVNFYDRLQKISAGYFLPLMPFDAIKLSFKFEGLCPPGLGTSRYGEIGSVLMDILPRLLPATIPEVASAISTVGFESNNGYDLFWRVLELTIPGFDPTIPILPPVWC